MHKIIKIYKIIKKIFSLYSLTTLLHISTYRMFRTPHATKYYDVRYRTLDFYAFISYYVGFLNYGVIPYGKKWSMDINSGV